MLVFLVPYRFLLFASGRGDGWLKVLERCGIRAFTLPVLRLDEDTFGNW